MLVFDSNDPFPLVAEETYSYLEEQKHAEQVDAWLGIETEKVEKEIQRAQLREEFNDALKTQQQLWIGLPVQALLTPYTELRRILNLLKLKPKSKVIDLGCAYGRMGFVLNKHCPEVSFLGYEYVHQRVHESQRCLKKWNCFNAEVKQADLSESAFSPIEADAYFIYDFGAKKTIEKVLQDLRSVARERPITVIGRGRSVRDVVELGHPWLSSVYAPAHYTHYSLYRSGVDS